MKLEWMGNYRSVVEAMIAMGNAYSRIYKEELLADPGLSPAQIQVLEYILENEDEHDNMSDIAKRLYISQSSFSKITSQLVKKGLLEKYHSSSNKKNVIIKVSAYGKKCYEDYSRSEFTAVWGRIFEKLDGLDDKTIQVFIDCLNEFTNQLVNSRSGGKQEAEEIQLIRID